jgi:3-methylcrotonyl-CoA carboxylase alpha subunit
MFKKILIANRGEIAIRIMATCREMGIRTVAIYSEADRHARHVREADEAYYIGPAPSTQSYLRADTIIDIARQSGAAAIHPGYGFLSENADFAEACAQAGIVFIGPPASAMRQMGSKIAAKQLAQSVGVPTVPGYNGEQQDTDTLFAEAQRIGFPLLIKASAGGGGKGMRVVSNADDFIEQLAGARREAAAAFGDATVFLERLLLRPRHIEIQVLADQYGHTIHLGERECSIQRRHQKILEESPSIALTPALREQMGAAAVHIAQAAGYVNAGTLEFMLDADHQFYFLEMNTRLQVEHPVTELVTGFDLVRHQLAIAAGEPLRLTQQQISQRGHAIEVRIYAEDPAQNFLPSTGTVIQFVKPDGPGIRLDSGIDSGDEISQYYDPMIAKLIVYGEDRHAAIARLQKALEQCAIFGVTTNIPLLHAISKHTDFEQGQTHTDFLAEHATLLKTTTPSDPLPPEVLYAAAIYDTQQDIESRKRLATNGQATSTSNPWQMLGPWRMIGGARRITYRWQEQDYHVSLLPSSLHATGWDMQVNAASPAHITCTFAEQNLLLLQQQACQTRLYVQQQPSETLVALDGQIYHLPRQQPPDVATTAHGGTSTSTQKMLTAPMAGTIVKVHVHDGDIVQANQVLVILSAMKMEHAIIAPHDGKIQHIYYQEGAVVPGGATVAEMENL